MLTIFLAQTNTNNAAKDILDAAFQMNQNTTQEWQSLWDYVIFDSANSPLWLALINTTLTIAALGTLYLALAKGIEIVQKQDWRELVQILIWPLVIAFFLHNNGYLLAQSVGAYRLVGSKITQNVLAISYGGLSLQAAINDFSISNSSRQQLEAISSECNQYTGDDFVNCFRRNQETIERIVQEAERRNNNQPNYALRGLAQAMITSAGLVAGSFFPPLGVTILASQAAVNTYNAVKDHGANVTITIVRGLLMAIQWAFVNCLEIAFLLTALYAPIALGLSILPMQGKPIMAWLTTFTAIMAIQLGYNIIIGLTSIVAIKSGGQLNNDIAFMILLAIFAPILAYLIGKGGGTAIYENTSQKLTSTLKIAGSGLKKLAGL